ncbi:MAG: head GIN domain-containing protein [Tenacibaculum sp.]
MKKVFIISLILTSFNSVSQNKITRELNSFKNIKVFNGIEVNLVQASDNKAVITGEKSDKVKIKIQNDILRISLTFPETLANKKAKVELYYNSPLDIIDANEGAVITSKKIKQSDVEIKAQEGAFVNMIVDVDYLKVKSSSGAVVKLSGNTKNQTVNVDLGANYHGYKLKVKNVNIVRAASGAKAEVNCGGTLDAKVSFGGTIFYKGEPKVLKEKKVVGGVIKNRT